MSSNSKLQGICLFNVKRNSTDRDRSFLKAIFYIINPMNAIIDTFNSLKDECSAVRLFIKTVFFFQVCNLDTRRATIITFSSVVIDNNQCR